MLPRTLLHEGPKYNIELVHSKSSTGTPITREVIRHPGSVIILPMLAGTASEPNIVLIRNYRISLEQTIIELPAGTRSKPDENAKQESPHRCAERELEEETGYRAATIKLLASWLTAPGLTDEVMHFFLATDLTHVGQHLERDETIQPLIASASLAINMIANGEITDAKTMLALLWAKRAGIL